MDLETLNISAPKLRRPQKIEESIDLELVRRAPLAFLERCTGSYGKVFSYSAGPWNAVVINDPGSVHDVLKADGERFSKLGTPDLMMLRPMLGEGLMTSEGHVWRQQRDEAVPLFSPRRVAEYVAKIQRSVSKLADRWTACAQTGAMVDVETEMNHLALEIVVECLFGFDLDEHSGDFAQAVGTMNKAMAHYDGTGDDLQRGFDQALDRLHDIVRQIVLKRHILSSFSAADDLLSQLMNGAAGRRLFDRIFTFVMAGHETTAKSLTWSFHLLSQHPDAARRVAREGASADIEMLSGQDVPGALPFTWAVLQEAMRLYPPVWSMTRMSLCAQNVGGYEIEAGEMVLISPYVMHRHVDFWDTPLAFEPERFLRALSCPRSYIPFSAGPRTCIGRYFAQTEGVLALARLTRDFDVTVLPDHPVEPEALITLRPRHGLLAGISHRDRPGARA